MHADQQGLHVLIVEDEIAVRRSIISKIPWGEKGLVLSGEARNAEEALEMIKERSPDILLLDMRMPGMGGPAFLDLLEREYPEIQVIIISGYSDFKYVQHALKRGAADYLLKPIIKEELIQALHYAAERIELERQQASMRMAEKMLLHQSIPLLKRSLLNSLLQGGAAHGEIFRKLEMLNVRFEHPWYALAVVRVMDFDRIKERYGRNSALVFFALDNVMQETAISVVPFVGFKSDQRENEYLCLLGFDSREGSRSVMEQYFALSRENLETYNHIQVQITVSGLFSCLSEMYRVYDRLIRSEHRMGNDQPGVRYVDDTADEQVCNWLTEEEIGTLKEMLGRRDIRGLTDLVKRKFADAESQFGDDMAVYRRLAVEIYLAVEEIVRRIMEDDEPAMFPASLDWVREYDTPNELIVQLIRVLDGIGENVGTGSAKDVIQKVRKYIDRHFYEDITLDSLAQRFYMNRTYLSEQFSRETGLPFKKYLNKVRVDKAKELLLDQSMKAANVALLVGFHDPVYFSSVFKKYTGMTITEFIERNKQAQGTLS